MFNPQKASMDRIYQQEQFMAVRMMDFFRMMIAGWSDFLWNCRFLTALPGITKSDMPRQNCPSKRALVQNLILEIKQQVWNDFAQLKEAYQALQATETIVEEAQESMRLTQERYQVGQSTTNDLLDARTALVRAEGNRFQAGWDYYTALVDAYALLVF